MGAIDLTDLQTSYDVSPDGRIIVDATRGPVKIRDAAVPIGDLFVVEDNGAAIKVRAGLGDAALFELNSTTQGLRLPRMTEVQRDAIGAPLQGLLVFNTTTSEVNQYTGAAWTLPGGEVTSLTLTGLFSTILNLAQNKGASPVTVDLAPVVNLVGLNTAYLNVSTILLTAGQGPVTIRDNAAPLGTALFQVTDSAAVPFVRASATGIDGGTVNTANLTLAANSVLTGAGRILANSPIVFGSYSATTASYGFSYTAVESFSAAFIGGGLNFSGAITFTNGVFIYESFRGAPNITTAVNPGFAAYTVLQALPRFESGSGAGHNPLPPLILNAGPRINHGFTGTRTVSVCAAINFAGTLSTSAAGTINVTSWTGMTVAPKWSTVAGSTINFGTIRGLHVQNPAVAPFGGSSAGFETMTALIGVDVDAISSLGGAFPVVAAVRSGITAAINRFFLVNNGGAASLFASGVAHFNDNSGVLLGGTYLAADVLINWNASALEFAFTAFADDLRISNPANTRFLWQGNAGIGAGGDEFNWACSRFSIGAQTGAVGNQIGAFVAGLHTVTIGGDFTQFLLTQAASGTIDAALGLYAGWTINAPTPIIGTGSVTTVAGLNVGGNPAVGTNRVGVRILSNPVGGGGVNAALWVTAGRSQFDGFVDINKPVALGGGAAATLGLIGGAGPTAAAQAQWIEIEVAGVRHWIAVWT